MYSATERHDGLRYRCSIYFISNCKWNDRWEIRLSDDKGDLHMLQNSSKMSGTAQRQILMCCVGDALCPIWEHVFPFLGGGGVYIFLFPFDDTFAFYLYIFLPSREMLFRTYLQRTVSRFLVKMLFFK